MKYLILDPVYGGRIAIPFATGADIAPIIAAMTDAAIVDQKGYGEDEKFVPTSNSVPSFRIVAADKVTIGSETDTLKALLDETKSSLEVHRKWLEQEREKVKSLMAKSDAPSAA